MIASEMLLYELVDDVWNEFVKLKGCEDEFTIKKNNMKESKKISEIIVPTMPIIYFGDYNKYRESKIKIVTVSLNPSDREFKKNKNDSEYSFFRFQSAKDLYGKDRLNEDDIKKYLESINNYFNIEPYREWFDDNRRHLFKIFDASYYKDEKENVPLHIDLATAIATNPTWGGLPKEAKQLFLSRNKGKWTRLLEILSPDIMLLSLDTKYLKEVDRNLYEKLQENIEEYQEANNTRKKKYLTSEVSLKNEKIIKVMDIVTSNKAFQFTKNGLGQKKFTDILLKWKEEIECQR